MNVVSRFDREEASTRDAVFLMGSLHVTHKPPPYMTAKINEIVE